jgi:negative regulator of sigma E activity
MSFSTVTNPQKKNKTVTIANAAGYRSLPPVAVAACALLVVVMAIVLFLFLRSFAASYPPRLALDTATLSGNSKGILVASLSHEEWYKCVPYRYSSHECEG